MFIEIHPLMILRVHLLSLLQHLRLLLIVVLKIQLNIDVILMCSGLLHFSNCWNIVGVIILHVEHQLVFVNIKKTRQKLEIKLFLVQKPLICFASIGSATLESVFLARPRRGVQRKHLLLSISSFTCLQLHLSLNFIHRHDFLLARHLTVNMLILISYFGCFLFGVTFSQVVDNFSEFLLVVLKPLQLFVHVVQMESMHLQLLRNLIWLVGIKQTRRHIFHITAWIIEYFSGVTRFFAVGTEAFLSELLV